MLYIIIHKFVSVALLQALMFILQFFMIKCKYNVQYNFKTLFDYVNNLFISEEDMVYFMLCQ